MHSTAQQFGLDLRVYEGSFVKGLQRCMAEMEAETTVGTTVGTAVGTTVGTTVGQQQQRRTGPLAFGFVLGTRRGDPNCGVQTAFTPSSDWMPPFMRVNPILDWEYGQVSSAVLKSVYIVRVIVVYCSRACSATSRGTVETAV